jgi:PAS domain S-box-containing protein
MERNQTKEYLDHFRRAVEAASNAIGMSTPDGKHWYQNKTFGDLFGNIGDDPPASLYVDEKVGRKVFETIMAGGQWTGEVTMRGKNGKLLNIFLRAYAVKDNNEKVIGLVGVHTDITKERQDLGVLHLQHDLGIALSGATNLKDSLTLIVDTAIKIPHMDSGGVYIIDQDTKALNLLYSKGLSPLFVDKISHYEKDSEQAKIISKGKPIYAEYTHLEISKNPDKQKENLHAIAIIPIQYQGEAIGALNIASHSESSISPSTREYLETIASQVGSAIARVIIEDKIFRQNHELLALSDRLQKEIDERIQAEKTLKEEKERFRILSEESPLGISMIGKDGRYIYINRRFVEILGYKLEDIPTGREWFRSAFPDKKYRRHIISTWISDKNKAGVEESRPRTFTVTCKDGEQKAIDFRPTAMDGDDQLVIYEDVTEKRRLEARLQQAQKMEAIGTLAGGIAHDFNNILSPLIGYTEMLKEDLSVDSPFQTSVDEIFRASLRARDLVQQILAFSRQTEDELKPIKLQPVIKEAMKLLRSSLPKTIDIQPDIDSKCGAVIAAPTQIHQIVMNLATNAYHAMEDTGGILKITLRQVWMELEHSGYLELLPGAYACLIVADTGIGIEKDIFDKIFDPYFTTKKIGKGTGLGLSVVHGIVKSCKGDIRIDSEPGKGTEIHVYLPILEQRIDKNALEVADRIQGGTERILLVDDEEAIVRMEQQMLDRLGYEVTTRTGSVDALEAFKANPDRYDLIITDMTMPNMTGILLSKEIKRIRPEIPIIICTGFSDQINEEKCKAMGIQGYVMKPIVGSEIADTIREVLDKSEKLEEGNDIDPS